MERAYKPAPIWLTEIFDPVAGVAYLLDDQKKVAHRMPLPPAAASTASQPAPNLTIETWESPELKLTLVTKSSNGYTGRLTNLSRNLPDSALFRPPSDYKVVDESAPFPMAVLFSDRVR